jgi:hypothetical protein
MGWLVLAEIDEEFGKEAIVEIGIWLKLDFDDVEG